MNKTKGWLFAEDRIPPYAPGSATSRAAAVAAAPKAGTQRQRVLEAIRSSGYRGCTRPELAEATGLPLQSICARASELLEGGLIVVSEQRRRTRFAKWAEVLVAKEVHGCEQRHSNLTARPASSPTAPASP